MPKLRFLLTILALLTLAGCTSYLPQGATVPSALSAAVIVQKVNQVRAAYGKPPLRYNTALAKAAQRQADLMAQKDTLSHDLGETLRERVRATGYVGAVGEDVAGGQKTLESALTGWLQSAAHQRTLLSEKFTEFGLGVARVPAGTKSRHGIYWSIVLGGPFALWSEQ